MRDVVVVGLLCFCASASLPDADADGLTFTDIDIREGYVAGTAYILRASNETTIDYYSIYFSVNASAPASRIAHPLGYPLQAVVDNIGKPTVTNPAHPDGMIRLLIAPTAVPDGASSLIVLSKNEAGLKADTTAMLSLVDVTSQPLPRCANTQLSAPSGALEDGSGSANYTSAVENPAGAYECVWTISHANITKFLFRVTHLNLDPFNFDSLCLYNGIGQRTGNDLIECFTESTGAERPYNLVSSGNAMEAVLTVDSSISGDGFRAVYYGLDARDFENSVDESVLKIRYDQHEPVGCHCVDVDCQSESANCVVDEGNGKGFATCANLDTC